MKLNLLSASTLALGLALAGAPTASAQTAFVPPENIYLATTIDGTPFCLAVNIAHGGNAYITADTSACTPISFPVSVSVNNKNWWEVEMSNDLCLNWSTDILVYSDYCVGDDNELWYNHDPGKLINLEGNIWEETDAYLQPCYNEQLINGVFAYYLCAEGGTAVSGFRGWSEQPDP